ncbi:MAG: hypothetical protein AMK70_04200 [Nitrospira bacterium SG8_35_1]|nr:MAG: hypothetical protein AMK70_04200 [Nitrospira bacterium SG8_35_1]
MQVSDIWKYPSVMATHKETFGRTSEKYQFVPTTRVVKILEDNGWFPVLAQEARVTKNRSEGFQRHMLRFRQENSPSLSDLNEVYAEIILENSHDGSRAFHMTAGAFVKVCSNGLIVSEGLVQSFRIKHIGFTKSRVKEAIEVILAATPRIGSHIDHFNNIRLSHSERMAYSTCAILTKFDMEFLKTHHIDPESLITTKREEEKDPTLWNTFNVVQEKIITGGIKIHNKHEDHTDFSCHRKSRRVTSISENIRLNKALWNLTEHVACLKTH